MPTTVFFRLFICLLWEEECSVWYPNKEDVPGNPCGIVLLLGFTMSACAIILLLGIPNY